MSASLTKRLAIGALAIATLIGPALTPASAYYRHYGYHRHYYGGPYYYRHYYRPYGYYRPYYYGPPCVPILGLVSGNFCGY